MTSNTIFSFLEALYHHPRFDVMVTNIIYLGILIATNKNFKESRKKPIVNFTKIITQKQVEKDIYISLIRFQLFNQDDSFNHFSISLSRPRIPKIALFSIPITSNVTPDNFFEKKDSYYTIGAFNKGKFQLDPKYNEVKDWINKKLILIIKDIRGKKTRKWFRFENKP